MLRSTCNELLQIAIKILFPQNTDVMPVNVSVDRREVPLSQNKILVVKHFVLCLKFRKSMDMDKYEGWNFNSDN